MFIFTSYTYYQSDFSIPLVLPHTISLSLSLSKSVISFSYFDNFSLSLLLYPANFFAFKSSSLSRYLSFSLSLYLLLLRSLYHYISLTFSLNVSLCLLLPLILCKSFSVFCCSSTICRSTHSLYVTVSLSMYLSLLLYNLLVAPMLFSCANTFQSSSFCVTLSRSSFLTFSSLRSLSLSLLFHQFHLTLFLYYSQFR